MRPRENITLSNMNIHEVSTNAKAMVVRQHEDGSIQILDDDKDRTPVIDETTGEVLAIHGEQYKLLPNSKFIEIVKGVTGDEFKGYVNSERTRLDVYYYPDDFRVNVAPDGQEDYINIGIRFSNSYDGSSALRTEFVGIRMACSNGMILKDIFDEVSTRHTVQAITPEEFAELINQKFGNTDLNLLKSIMQEAQETTLVFDDISLLEWVEGFSMIEGLPEALKKHIQLEILKKDTEDMTRYDLYNMLTRAVTHGYVKGKDGMISSDATTYSESYLQRMHRKINQVLFVTEHDIKNKVTQLRQADEIQEQREKLEAQITQVAEQ